MTNIMEDGPTDYSYWCDGSCYHIAEELENQTMGMGVYSIEPNKSAPQAVERRLAISGPVGSHNEAEYIAIMCALYDLYIMEGAKYSGGSYIVRERTAKIHSDSQLVIRQILRRYQVRNPRMVFLLEQVKVLLDMLRELKVNVSFKWNPRDTPYQQEADRLSKLGNPYFRKKTLNRQADHQVEGPIPLEEMLPSNMYQTIKNEFEWMN